MQPEYIYDDRSLIRQGNIVHYLSRSHADQYIKGDFYIVAQDLHPANSNSISTVLDGRGASGNGLHMRHFRKVKTYPGNMNINGDKAIYIGDSYKQVVNSLKVGSLHTSYQTSKDYFYWNKGMNNRNTGEWLILATVNNINNERLIK